MDRREFSKSGLLLGTGMLVGCQEGNAQEKAAAKPGHYLEPPKNLPIRRFDVVVAGAGTGGDQNDLVHVSRFAGAAQTRLSVRHVIPRISPMRFWVYERAHRKLPTASLPRKRIAERSPTGIKPSPEPARAPRISRPSWNRSWMSCSMDLVVREPSIALVRRLFRVRRKV